MYFCKTNFGCVSATKQWSKVVCERARVLGEVGVGLWRKLGHVRLERPYPEKTMMEVAEEGEESPGTTCAYVLLLKCFNFKSFNIKLH